MNYSLPSKLAIKDGLMNSKEFLNLIVDQLSQPICSTNLNIKLLKIKLEKGELPPEINKELLESLDADVQRLFAIVESLRNKYLIGSDD